MNSDDEKKLKICYLFLSLEEPMTEANLLKFTQMGENFSGFEESKDAIIAECNQVIDESSDSDERYDVVIARKINKLVDSMFDYSSGGMFTAIVAAGFGNKTMTRETEQKQLLWMLESLAWYDGKCTANEKRIIRDFMSKWGIDKSVLLEMEDTAETLFMLDNYRTWIKTTGESYDYVNSVIQELDKNQKDISDNIAYTINLD